MVTFSLFHNNLGIKYLKSRGRTCHGEHQNVEISNSFVIDTCNATDVTVSPDMNENIENISVLSDSVVHTVNVNDLNDTIDTSYSSLTESPPPDS
jgi:hypothetical protein